MTARPWMAFYPADYVADTGHLSLMQHGAYLLLICHYWRRGELPTDDAQLSRIAKMTPDEWADNKVVIQDLFSPEWTHKRVDEELAEAEKKHNKRSEAGKAGNNARWHSDRIAIPERSQPQPQPQPESKEARKKETGKILLPDTWAPSVSHYELGAKWNIPKGEIDEWALEMRSWSLGNGERRRNWDWVFNNWIGRNVKRRNGNGGRVHDDSRSLTKAAERLLTKITSNPFDRPAPGGIRGGTGETVVQLIPQRRSE